MKLIVFAVAFVALVAEVTMAYYSYPDEYSSFADVDWGKRSDLGWIDSDYGWGSMADADWGWKKRSGKTPPRASKDVEDESEDDEAVDVVPAALSMKSRIYRSAYPYYNRFQRSRSLLDSGNAKSYAYHSMADADWGWKKRKRSSDPVVNMLTKRHLSSLAKTGRFRSRRGNL